MIDHPTVATTSSTTSSAINITRLEILTNRDSKRINKQIGTY